MFPAFCIFARVVVFVEWVSPLTSKAVRSVGAVGCFCASGFSSDSRLRDVSFLGSLVSRPLFRRSPFSCYTPSPPGRHRRRFSTSPSSSVPLFCFFSQTTDAPAGKSAIGGLLGGGGGIFLEYRRRGSGNTILVIISIVMDIDRASRFNLETIHVIMCGISSRGGNRPFIGRRAHLQVFGVYA